MQQTSILDNYVLPRDANPPKNWVPTQLDDGVTRFHGHEKGVPFRFFIHGEKNELRSKLAGVILYDKYEMIEYRVDKRTRVHEKVTEWHKSRYATEYDRFTKGLEAPGMPISRWDRLDEVQKKILIENGIFSVEQFAALPISKVHGVYPPDICEAFEEACQYVAGSHSREQLEKAAQKMVSMEKENAKLTSAIEQLQAQVAALIEGGKAPKAPRKGVGKKAPAKKGSKKVTEEEDYD